MWRYWLNPTSRHWNNRRGLSPPAGLLHSISACTRDVDEVNVGHNRQVQRDALTTQLADALFPA
jgi:hypothetical protein